MAHQVLISYSSQDKLVADAACTKLEAQRISCWIAPRDILAGTEYGEAIIEAISGCRILVLIFSVHANDSPQVRREVERAISKGKIIVPFRIEDVLPSRAMEFALSNTHWLDALTPPLERHLAKLGETISLLVQRVPGPAAAVEPPEDTQSPEAALIVANKYYKEKQYDRALQLFRRAAEAGIGEAAVSMGLMYAGGLCGLPKDIARAVSWYQKAADAGNVSGMFYLGLEFECGSSGLPEDMARAVSWYRKAAQLGDTAAQKALKRLAR